MNTLERAEHRMLVSMFVDAHRPERRFLTRQDFHTDYHVEVEPRLFDSIASDLRGRRLCKVTTQNGACAIRLHGDAYKAALERILSSLNADTFEVDWPSKHIVTDADNLDYDDLIPCPNSWMLLTVDKTRIRPVEASAVDASASPFSQTAGRDVNNFYHSVHGHGVSNQAEEGREGPWARWSTVFGGISLLLTMIGLLAAWYFWRYQP